MCDPDGALSRCTGETAVAGFGYIFVTALVFADNNFGVTYPVTTQDVEVRTERRSVRTGEG